MQMLEDPLKTHWAQLAQLILGFSAEMMNVMEGVLEVANLSTREGETIVEIGDELVVQVGVRQTWSFKNATLNLKQGVNRFVLRVWIYAINIG